MLIHTLKALRVLVGLCSMLFLYQLQVVQHGLLPVMAAGAMTPEMMVFSLLATLPVAVIIIWPFIESRWPGLYLAAIPFNGTRYLIDLNRWRAALIAALMSLAAIEVVL